MKITFTQDHQSPLSGNEYYKAGTRADLPKGATLVHQGIADEGWGPWNMPANTEPNEEPPPLEEEGWTVAGLVGVDLSQYTVAVLQEVCQAFGIPYSGLLKAQLIAAITAYIEANT